ncbi:DCC family protein At1g52590, chloroplastic [Cynara cardunculus var. scolymus]|uniref:DCC family protein At1g52590, chloroplastic n=1 Tax=Cynara cardunculus var. scolymus TaxID=59895 RepID=UPI000D62C83B|nr:DCC family protein At1g52590, chloroplastic [Cynara cardunculus var. scolymus]XP_024979908.1 DCC family protein At1g52590, chloroplastic [Cynara cardunculus var. scolymus]XP_024979909.1 DCC family protein At1g52590, chloroplastic [Cynara cardunculus var. scolymus]
MALIPAIPTLAASGARLSVLPPIIHVRSSSRRRSAVLANLSSPPRGGEALDWVEATSSFFEQDTRPIMLFDGVCNLCNGGVKFVRDNDRQRRIRFEALQSDAGKNLLRRSGRAPDDISSVVLVEKNRSYIKSEAVLKIMEYIDLPFPQLAFFLQFVPLFIRDIMYENLADNRYAVFGRSESCEI